MTSLPYPSTAPVIRSREQLDAVVENIVRMRQELREILRTQEREIASIREKHRGPLSELDSFLQKESAWVEAWVQSNPSELDENRCVECPQATIGFRVGLPRVERASRKWTWTEAALKLAETTWGRRYLRIPSPEVDKEAILADLRHLPVDDLRESGIKIVQGERFFIEAHEAAEETVSSGTSWQEAA